MTLDGLFSMLYRQYMETFPPILTVRRSRNLIVERNYNKEGHW